MAEHKTISRQAPDKQDLDFAWLREEGLRHIRELASRIWTDHNTHDPGITMLETLCYAITDLGYRCSFPVEDLLASDPGNRIGSSPDFFEAYQALPNRPLTINDYRKLLIDLPGIRNAWLEPAVDSEQRVYYDGSKIGLTYDATTEPIDIRGLYNVRVEFEEDPELGDLNSSIIQKTLEAGEKTVHLEVAFPYPDQVTGSWLKKVDIQSITTTLVKSDQEAYDFIAHAKVKLAGIAKLEHFDLKISLREPHTEWKPVKTQVETGLKQLVTDISEAGIFALFSRKMILQGSLLETVSDCLYSRRNLCEDFLKIGPVKIQEIVVEGDIEVTLDAPPEEMLAQMYFTIYKFIDPPVNFRTLAEMLTKYSPEEIFDGPLLNHGFIEDENLLAFNDRGALYVSDILQILMGLQGNKVIAIKALRLGNYIDNVRITDDALNCLNLFKPQEYKPELSVWRSDIRLKKRGIEIQVDKDKVIERYNELVAGAEPDKSILLDPRMDQPFGKDRKTGNYFSIQEHMPQTYGISSSGLPDSAGAIRIAQSRQLKGYLLFFDQLLANFLAQVSNLKNIFSIDPGIGKSYFEQAVYQVPGAMYVLKDFAGLQPSMEDKAALDAAWEIFVQDDTNAYRTSLSGMMEGQQVFLERRNRFLDHLMARFCEEFTDYSLLVFSSNQQQVPQLLVDEKVRFLQELPQIGSERGSALILEGPGAEAWDTLNVSGLEHRVSRFLGFADYTRRFLTHGQFDSLVFYQEKDEDGIDEYRFRIVDGNGQILLSSTKHYNVLEDGYDVIYQVIESGRQEVNYKIIKAADGQFFFNLYNSDIHLIARRIDLFPTEDDAKQKRDEVIAFMNTHFEGIQDEPEEGMHIIEHTILRPRYHEGTGSKKIHDPLMPVILDDFGNLEDEGKDPYSFRITAVFPSALKKLMDPNFKELANRILRLETPAHVMPQVFFLDNIQLSRFEYALKNWLELRIVPVPDDPDLRVDHLQALSQALTELIGAMQFLPEP